MELIFIRNKEPKQIEVEENSTIQTLIDKMQINEETIIVKLNDKFVHTSKKLKKGDQLEIIDIIYGG